MCGIVGAVARGNVVPVLLEGLRRLEYRGYDSAGIAVVNGSMKRLRSTGRVAELASLADGHGLSGNVGIAHTRWATHGVPSVKNAHPHVSGGVSVVHNGIIENHDGMRRKLQLAGYQFVSDTDTEVIAHLVHSHLVAGRGLLEAVRASVAELTGAYAIAVIHEPDPTRLVVARMGAPLLLGLGDEGRFAASDANVAAFPRCRRAGRLPALHAEGDLRAAGGGRRHARDGDQRRGGAPGAVRARRRPRAERDRLGADHRVRHQPSCRDGRPLL